MQLFSLPPSEVNLIEWNIVVIKPPYVEKHTELFIGYSLMDELGRLSTPVVEYDEKSLTGLTKSGSIYHFIGSSTMPHEYALYVLREKIGSEFYDKLMSGEDDNLFFKYDISI